MPGFHLNRNVQRDMCGSVYVDCMCTCMGTFMNIYVCVVVGKKMTLKGSGTIRRCGLVRVGVAL